jgi:hypothetical protein
MNTYKTITFGTPVAFMVIGVVFTAMMISSAQDIIPLDGGNGFTSGNGIIVCGEAISLNATADISDEHLRSMFEEAMVQRNTTCTQY